MRTVYIVVSNSAPLDTMPKVDLGKAVSRAQDWCKHLRRDVHVLAVSDSDVSTAHIEFWSTYENVR